MKLEVSIKKKLKEFTLDVNFTLQDAAMGLMGASGCGKSMTLKCIAGIQEPDEGRIVLDGRVLYDSALGVNLKPQDRRIGYMFQSYALFPNMSVQENILCGLETRGLAKTEEQQALQVLLERFQLSGLAERYSRQLSGGQRQRVALARMLAAEPLVVLLDEPFSALDSNLKQELQNQMKQLLRERTGLALLVSHDKQEVAYLADYYKEMHEGGIKDNV